MIVQINNIDHKIGDKGFIFYRVGNDWKKSSKNKSEYLEAVYLQTAKDLIHASKALGLQIVAEKKAANHGEGKYLNDIYRHSKSRAAITLKRVLVNLEGVSL
ncbi:MAG: hypothetical protein GY818_07010 [Planctomycetaceae bacterium]|nr:hypothetical protein [Planctomycetaceae bacterium]